MTSKPSRIPWFMCFKDHCNSQSVRATSFQILQRVTILQHAIKTCFGVAKRRERRALQRVKEYLKWLIKDVCHELVAVSNILLFQFQCLQAAPLERASSRVHTRDAWLVVCGIRACLL